MTLHSIEYHIGPRTGETREEKWKRDNAERRLHQLHQIGKPPESANAITAAVVGYSAWKSGDTTVESGPFVSDVTDSKPED